MNKLKILFVDDEKNIVQGLKRMLFPMRKKWEQYFVTNGEDALKIIENYDIDIIVTDMQMPKMNGVELLGKVRKNFPEVIRIILSGQADNELALKSISVAHQFINKPCDSEELKKVIKKSLELKTHLHDNKNIQKLVTGIDQLPVLPDIYLEIENELNKQERSISKVGEIISKNPSITAKILQVVNSAFFGLPKNVSSPVEAVNFLGLEIIKSLVLYIPLFEQKIDDQRIKLKMNNLLNHCINTANYAIDLYHKLKLPRSMKEDVYIAALLHDIGKLLIMKNKQACENIEQKISEQKIKHNEAEKIILGTTHAEIGAYLLGIWGIPDQIVKAIIYHHNIEKQSINGFDLFNITYLSNFAQSLSNEKRIELEEYFKNEHKEISLKSKIEELING